MMEVKSIYCPNCMKKGKHKLLGRYRPSESNHGVVYLWCKEEKREVRIDLRELINEGK